MSITVVDFNKKTYKIFGCNFITKNITLGIKRRAVSLASIVALKMQELITVSKKYDVDVKSGNLNKSDVVAKLVELAERINKINDDLFSKGEEFLNLILEPANANDADKLVADNLDVDVLMEVINDFFYFAGVLQKPVNE